MKKSDPVGNDVKLSKLLHEWKADASLPPRFQDGVWRQIESASGARAATPSVWSVFAHWIGTLLPRPAMATAYVTVLLTIGVTAGWAQAHQTIARVKNELGERYVRVLDPYQAPRN
jgi:opacity protein-like surface antigen